MLVRMMSVQVFGGKFECMRRRSADDECVGRRVVGQRRYSGFEWNGGRYQTG